MPGVIALPRLVELLSVNPARILRVPRRIAGEGAPADITVLAPDLPVTVDRGDAAIEVEEHAVRRLALQRRRGGDDRRRPHGVCEQARDGRRTVSVAC